MLDTILRELKVVIDHIDNKDHENRLFKCYEQLEKYMEESFPLESQVVVKLADIIKFISDWGALEEAPEGKFENIEDKTLRRLIRVLDSKFSA